MSELLGFYVTIIQLESRTKALLLLAIIVGSTLIWYWANNFYETWAETANPLAGLSAYYLGTQGLYIGFIILFTWTIYKEDESIESAIKGFVGALLITIGLDLTGLPFAFPSILNVNQTVTLQPSMGTSPYADYQLAKWIAGPSGVVTFWNDLFVHVMLPIILVVVALVIVKPNMFVELVSRD